MTADAPKIIDPNDLVPMNHFVGQYPIKIDLVYAQPFHLDNHFPDLYHPLAKLLWAHELMAKVILVAAEYCNQRYGWTLQLNDCLRPVEAQMGMAGYNYDPSLVSLPGTGAHPRAMAVDIEPIDRDGKKVPMGTRFDDINDPNPETNPAGRKFTKFDTDPETAAAIITNRKKLEEAMVLAGEMAGIEIWPLDQEWWDFRFYPAFYEQFKPLSEVALLPFQSLMSWAAGADEILTGNYPDAMARKLEDIERQVSGALGFPASPRSVRPYQPAG